MTAGAAASRMFLPGEVSEQDCVEQRKERYLIVQILRHRLYYVSLRGAAV